LHYYSKYHVPRQIQVAMLRVAKHFQSAVISSVLRVHWMQQLCLSSLSNSWQNPVFAVGFNPVELSGLNFRITD
jgi:hypothetical protein